MRTTTKVYSQNNLIGEYYDTEKGMVIMIRADEKTEKEYKRLVNIMVEHYFRVEVANETGTNSNS